MCLSRYLRPFTLHIVENSCFIKQKFYCIVHACLSSTKIQFLPPRMKLHSASCHIDVTIFLLIRNENLFLKGYAEYKGRIYDVFFFSSFLTSSSIFSFSWLVFTCQLRDAHKGNILGKVLLKFDRL